MFDEGGREPLFVKNLERVQGDERDAIILTIGYGRTSGGRLVQNFGPVNQQGGERRLNVAITRAKRRVTVVSSFGSEDIDPARATGDGVRLLQGYLRYAESAGTDLGGVIDARPELNGFERDVLAALGALGIGVVSQLGTSGYYLDFALQHPTKPGRFVLAVECDGASYHSAPNTRERDRLRQQQLEIIGWHFHRIWSTDWFRNRDAEVARLKAAFDAAVAIADGAVPVMPAAPPVPAVPGQGSRARRTRDHHRDRRRDRRRDPRSTGARGAGTRPPASRLPLRVHRRHAAPDDRRGGRLDRVGRAPAHRRGDRPRGDARARLHPPGAAHRGRDRGVDRPDPRPPLTPPVRAPAAREHPPMRDTGRPRDGPAR